ncbi:MAG: aminotransferase class V-fold PLP-dependent enzyme [Phycisphaerales bacterium]
MPTRRDFLTTAAGALAAAPTLALARPALASMMEELAAATGSPDEIARDEDFWARAQLAFTVDRSIINLNNGGVSPAPATVQDAMRRHLDFSNECPPHNMWHILEPQREQVRDRLARQWGVDAEEIAITRNASEGLQICQLGFDLSAGEEVLTTTQDYGRMVNTFKQRVRREGIRLNQFKIPVPCEDDDEIVRLFESNITARTKLILMCHMINLTGQILPVAKVVKMARGYGIPVIVDGAHALAHFDFKLSDLGCDYYATSLHKWLFAPHGTGLLYVRKEKIKDLWPLMAAADTQDEDIRKFEEIGTHPAANFLAIAEALTFHQALGGARKAARMVHLREHWMDRLGAHDRVSFNTSRTPGFACGIANVRIDGLETSDLQSWLWKQKRILTVAINHDEFNGLRVSPSVFTTHEELDRFCDAVEMAMRVGIG